MTKPGARRPQGSYGEAEQRRALLAAQSEHTGVLLWRATRAWMAEFRHRLDRAGYADLPDGAFHNVMPFLDIEGTRNTVLAERAGISKQAVNQFVDQLEALGYIERIADEEDGRAKIVRYTGRGIAFVRDNQRVKRQLEVRFATELGPGSLENLHDLLRTATSVLLRGSKTQ
jgi:DNA-binding MarR family transcriptional regulator